MTYQVSVVRVERFNNNMPIINPMDAVVKFSSKCYPVYEEMTLRELSRDVNFVKTRYCVSEYEIAYIKDKARLLIEHPENDAVNIDLDLGQLYWFKHNDFFGL